MKYRSLDVNGDYVLGSFLSNTPETVAQAVQTRLALWMGEFFMDTSDGTPYYQDILGHNTNYDLEIQDRILGTTGVGEIISYSSSVVNRALSVTCTISTIYGTTSFGFPQ